MPRPVGFVDLLEHDRAGALQRYLRGLEVAVASEAEQLVPYAAYGVAFAAAEVDPCAAARILGASRAMWAARGIVLDRTDEASARSRPSSLPTTVTESVERRTVRRVMVDCFPKWSV